jgi:hypothetical protein
VNCPSLDLKSGPNKELQPHAKKKRKQTIKSRGGGGRVALAVGEDLQVSQIVDLHGQAIVGKFVGRPMAYNTILT